MKPVSHLRLIVVALMVPAIVIVISGLSCSAQTGYTVNGRAVSASTYQAYKIVNESLQLMKQNRVSEAADRLRVALRLDPTVGEARGMLGMALARLGQTDEAAEQMRMAILNFRDLDTSGEPRMVLARINLATLYQSAGKTQDALDMYRKLLAEYPHTKMAPALQERVALLDREVKRQQRARAEHRQELADESTYLGNVILQGRRRWPATSMPIRVYVYAGDGMSGFNPQYDNILHESFEEWQRASNGKVTFSFVDSPRQADITCTWIDDPKLLESSAEGGEAEVQSLLESITRTRILLSLNEGGSAFPFTPNLVRALCLHEIGHSLGLMGHSTNADDVLYCSTPIVDREQHLSARDAATLNALYKTDVDPVSNFLALLEKQTKGNALGVVRTVIVLFTFVMAALIALIMIMRKKKSKKKPRTSVLG